MYAFPPPLCSPSLSFSSGCIRDPQIPTPNSNSPPTEKPYSGADECQRRRRRAPSDGAEGAIPPGSQLPAPVVVLQSTEAGLEFRPGSQTAGSARPAAPTHRHQKSRGSTLDDDDDSEVEMLSISSGDEEVSKDRPPAKGRAGGGGAGRGGKDDDGWDGGEPDCWKRVDEAEVMCISSSLSWMPVVSFLFADC
ncbi:unnamed protein product [Linum tenue]|uniref:Uncharacterized protein n=1 Tax=Linum tenue TaxID=586396 RepID=A0AAV0R7C2_9ROSI|nr:unnamed protein product [Linum tenue]